MTQIPSARGPIETSALGRTFVHEHIFTMTPDVQQNYPDEWDEESRVADAIERLSALKAAGIDTIADPTVVGLGRYIPRIARIAAEVDLNILVATGVYTYDDVPFYFRFRGPAPGEPDMMTKLFVRDITEGITGTGVRAAFLKCAIDEPGMTVGVERVLRAVAAAHLETAAPIMVHTDSHKRRGSEVHRLLDTLRVDPSRVMLAHSGDTADVNHLVELAEAGYLLGMDRFGIDVIAPFEQRVATVAALARRGYTKSMVLSHDASCYFDWIDPGLMSLMPNWHYLHITNDVLPALRNAGVTDEQIETMLVDNPRRWFEGATSG